MRANVEILRQTVLKLYTEKRTMIKVAEVDKYAKKSTRTSSSSVVFCCTAGF